MTLAWRLLWPYLRPHRIALTVALAAMVGEIATSLLLPVPIQRAIDLLVVAFGRGGQPGQTFTLSGSKTIEVIALAGALLVVALLDALFTYLDTATTTRVAQLAVTELRRSLFDHLQRLSLSFHHEKDTRTGDLQLRLSGDVSNLQILVGSVLGSLVTNAGTAAFMLGGLFLLDWRLGGVVLVGSAPVYLLSRHYGGMVRLAVREARRQEGRVSAMLAETLASAKLVQAFGREDHERDRMVDATAVGLAFDLRANEAQARLQPTVSLVTSAATALALLVAALLVLNRSLTVGLLTLALAYTRGTFSAFRQLARLPIQTQRAAVSAERLRDTFARMPQVQDPPRPKPVPTGPLGIAFDRVTFGYIAGRPVVEELTWRIDAGSLVALVGPTGAGKSSALALVPRLYDPWSGRITIGGVDVRELRLAELRATVTLILQESLLFRDTIWNNIAYGRPFARPREVMAAAEAAGVLTFADGLEEGLQTMVSERGSTLSGGQKQCIALARAMLRDAPVVIMDEPTSSLDAATEQLVIDGVASLIAGRTAVVIAHRFSTIQGADVVAVLEAGRLVELGPPQRLLDGRGLFAKLSGIQRMPVAGRRTNGAILTANGFPHEEVVPFASKMSDCPTAVEKLPVEYVPPVATVGASPSGTLPDGSVITPDDDGQSALWWPRGLHCQLFVRPMIDQEGFMRSGAGVIGGATTRLVRYHYERCVNDAADATDPGIYDADMPIRIQWNTPLPEGRAHSIRLVSVLETTYDDGTVRMSEASGEVEVTVLHSAFSD